jgi:hypothetical protein
LRQHPIHCLYWRRELRENSEERRSEHCELGEFPVAQIDVTEEVSLH